MPEILIRHRLLATRLPTVPFPLMDPFGDSMLDVVGIGHDLDLARFFQCAQPFDGSFELHAIVSSLRLGTEDLALFVAIPEDAGPTAGARIADTRSVSNELNLLQRTIRLHSPIRLMLLGALARKKHLPDPRFARPLWPCRFQPAVSIHCERRV